VKTGDWILFESRVVQVKKAVKGVVTCVSDGTGETGGNDLSEQCRPLTRRNLSISGNYEHRRARIDKCAGTLNINWPDIHDKLVEFWLDEIDATSDVTEESTAHFNKEWVDKFCKRLRELRDESVDGVPIYRQ
jgi:hypothetical protein